MKFIFIRWTKWKIRRCLNTIQLPSDRVQFSYYQVGGEINRPILKGPTSELPMVPNGLVFDIARLINLSFRKFAPRSAFLNTKSHCVRVHGTIEQKNRKLEVYMDGYARFCIRF